MEVLIPLFVCFYVTQLSTLFDSPVIYLKATVLTIHINKYKYNNLILILFEITLEWLEDFFLESEIEPVQNCL